MIAVFCKLDLLLPPTIRLARAFNSTYCIHVFFNSNIHLLIFYFKIHGYMVAFAKAYMPSALQIGCYI